MHILGRADAPWDRIFVFHYWYTDRPDAALKVLSPLLEHSPAAKSDQDLIEFSDETCKIAGWFLKPADSDPLVTKWNSKPESENYWMCHIPNHGIATLNDGRLDWCALICFQCESAEVAGPRSTCGPHPPNHRLPDDALTDGGLKDCLVGLLPPRPFPERDA